MLFKPLKYHLINTLCWITLTILLNVFSIIKNGTDNVSIQFFQYQIYRVFTPGVSKLGPWSSSPN